jgi:hypothetical protein
MGNKSCCQKGRQRRTTHRESEEADGTLDESTQEGRKIVETTEEKPEEKPRAEDKVNKDKCLG